MAFSKHHRHSTPARIASASPLSEQVRALRLPASTSSGGGSGRVAWALVVLLGATCGFLGYRLVKKEAAGPSPVVVVEKAATAAPAEVKEAGKSAGEIALEAKGYVIAAHQILVSPQVSGRMLVFNIEEGMQVAKGDVLAEIESTEYRADEARAFATLELAKQRLLELERGNRPEEIEQAKAEMAEANAQLQQLEAEWKRATMLVRNKSITDQDYEISESKFQAMARRVERLRFALKLMEDGPRVERIAVARAEVQQADADLAKAKYRLENCTIRAPVSGTILKKNAEQGNIVNPIALNGSFSVCDMADLSDLEVSLDIQERDIAHVFPGQKCQIRADAFPKRIYHGVVSRLMPIADRAKGAIPVRVKLQVPAEEEGLYLKPEMAAIVSFLGGERPEIVKPLAAPQKIAPASATPIANENKTFREAPPLLNDDPFAPETKSTPSSVVTPARPANLE